MRKKAAQIIGRMVSVFLTDEKPYKKKSFKRMPIKQQETRLCPHCRHSMAKTRTFCPHCQNFRNGQTELVRPIQGQFHY